MGKGESPLIRRFEDIEAWKKARELTRRVCAVTATGEFSRDYGLRDQIRRAAVSAMSNIAEGFERQSKIEFRRFLFVAKASAGEVRSQLYVALDLGYLDQPAFDEVFGLAEQTSCMIAGLIKYLDGKK